MVVYLICRTNSIVEIISMEFFALDFIENLTFGHTSFSEKNSIWDFLPIPL
jgi:hypothetical protein